MTETEIQIALPDVVKCLRQQFDTYIVLHAKNQPERVVECFLERFHSDPYSQELLGNFSEALRVGEFWSPTQVAEILLACETAWRAGLKKGRQEAEAFFDDHVKLIPVGFEKGSGSILGEGIEFTSEPVLRVEGGVQTFPNPFADLDPDTELGSNEVANILGRGRSYVKDHAEELGGTKNLRGQWKFRAGDLVPLYQTHKGE